MKGNPKLQVVLVVDAVLQQHRTLLNIGAVVDTVAGKSVYCSLQNYLH